MLPNAINPSLDPFHQPTLNPALDISPTFEVNLPLAIESIKGFLDADEGAMLYRYALCAAKLGPILEVGSYCGKSSVYLGAACKQSNSILFAVDHHRGSEEHQLGEEYHDAELYDVRFSKMDSFPQFRHTLARANLEDVVVPIVAPSMLAARFWSTPLALVFIDGGHSMEAALNDYRSWAGHVMRGGLLVIHDVFPNPADGGSAPFEIWKLAQESGLFEALPLVKTLGVLRRL
jgi:predicted O-methyltransferase YrrM